MKKSKSLSKKAKPEYVLTPEQLLRDIAHVEQTTKQAVRRIVIDRISMAQVLSALGFPYRPKELNIADFNGALMEARDRNPKSPAPFWILRLNFEEGV